MEEMNTAPYARDRSLFFEPTPAEWALAPYESWSEVEGGNTEMAWVREDTANQAPEQPVYSSDVL